MLIIWGGAKVDAPIDGDVGKELFGAPAGAKQAPRTKSAAWQGLPGRRPWRRRRSRCRATARLCSRRCHRRRSLRLLALEQVRVDSALELLVVFSGCLLAGAGCDSEML